MRGQTMSTEKAIVIKKGKKEKLIKTFLVGDKKPGLHPESSVGSAIPPRKG